MTCASRVARSGGSSGGYLFCHSDSRGGSSLVVVPSLACALGWTPVVEPAIFLDEVDAAVETLEQAIGETVDDAVRFRLRRWLHELTGIVR